MLVFFFPFFENLGSYRYVYDSMRAYGFVFERHQRTIFSLRSSCTACRTCSRCACLPARAGPPATAWLLSATRRQRRKVDKCRVADKKQTNRQTNKHRLLFYRYRFYVPGSQEGWVGHGGGGGKLNPIVISAQWQAYIDRSISAYHQGQKHVISPLAVNTKEGTRHKYLYREYT